MRTKEERQADRLARDAKLDQQDREAAERLARVQLDPEPAFFTDDCPEGKCGNCLGTQFEPAKGNIFGGKAWLLKEGREYVRCFTCGTPYRRGRAVNE